MKFNGKHASKSSTGQSLQNSRRNFLKYTGSAAVAGSLFLVGCEDDDDPQPKPDQGVNLGSGDFGILNYAYALEQLEAAYYTEVANNFAQSNLSDNEKSILDDLRKHEVAHREFYKAALGNNAIGALEVDFSTVDFANRNEILATAKTFEDLGVSAYNGAGKLLQDPNFLLAAGKIVSVEARHASAIRELINPGSTDFAGDDIIDSNGLGVVRTPSEVLAAADAFVITKIDASNLPS